jgi:uncharacterized membrane protein YjfL (UPF0719 family)
LYIAKLAYSKIFRKVDLKAELYARNNYALAVAVSGYFFGICLALGGALVGQSQGWQADLIAIGLYGILAIVLMLIAGFLCEKVLLHSFSNTKEIIEDQNLGTAFVEAGIHIANGLIVLAIVNGDYSGWLVGLQVFAMDVGFGFVPLGPLVSGIAFWLLAQVVLIVAGRLYEMITPHSIHDELERDNAAVGLAFAGLLVGMGNIISIAVAGDYSGWLVGLQVFAMKVGFGFVALYGIHKLTDVILAPGISLGSEQVKPQPNVGAGLIEAIGYLGGSTLIVWIF